MAVKITVINKNENGDPEFHKAGCADIAKQQKRLGDVFVETFEGETIIDALVALDTEWASAFGVKDPYSESAYENGCWTWGNMHQAPCMNTLMKAVQVNMDEFGGHSRPYIADALVGQAVAAGLNEAGIKRCQCGCGGSPKGKKSRFLPGHDAKAASVVKALRREIEAQNRGEHPVGDHDAAAVIAGHNAKAIKPAVLPGVKTDCGVQFRTRSTGPTSKCIKPAGHKGRHANTLPGPKALAEFFRF
jgi:hypothetical protein